MFDLLNDLLYSEPVVKVVGAGVTGLLAVERSLATAVPGVELLHAETDAGPPVSIRVRHVTPSGPVQGEVVAVRGVGQGRARIFGSANLVFVLADLGDPVGVRTAAQVARIARREGALVLAAVTEPATACGRAARDDVQGRVLALVGVADSVIVLPALASHAPQDLLVQALRSVTDLLFLPSPLCFDFSDLYLALSDRGIAAVGFGSARGEDRARRAARAALASPVLAWADIRSASAVLINVTAGPDLRLEDYFAASDEVRAATPDDALTAGGMPLERGMEDTVRVSVVLAGVDYSLA